MNEQIKQRITQLNNGEVPNGYENTDFGIFPCDWVTDKKLKDLGSFGKGKGLLGDKMTAEGVPCVRYGDIYMKYNHFHFEEAQTFVDEGTASESQPIHKGTLLFTGTGETADEIGKCVCYNGNETIYAGGDIITFVGDKVNPLFLAYQQYQEFSLRKKASFGQGHSVVHIQRENLEKLNVAYPKSTEEQSKIAEILMKWDEAIELYNQLIEKLKQLKSVCLKKMFPQRGEKVPEWRFKGFTDAWEQRKAIDIADYSKGNGYSKGDLTDAGTPIILYGRLYTKYQFAISEVDTFAVPRNGAVYSQGNEVIVPASGETAEDIARASAVEKSGVLLGGDLNILRPFDFMNPLFLALAISNGEPQKELAKKAQGKSVVHIHNSDIQEVTIAYPSRTEQDRIVSVFRQLDHLITLHQCKVEKIKAQQRVLQKYLLNGIVRV